MQKFLHVFLWQIFLKEICTFGCSLFVSNGIFAEGDLGCLFPRLRLQSLVPADFLIPVPFQAVEVMTSLRTFSAFAAAVAGTVAIFLACQIAVGGGAVLGPAAWGSFRSWLPPAITTLASLGLGLVASKIGDLRQRFFFVDYVHSEKD